MLGIVIIVLLFIAAIILSHYFQQLNRWIWGVWGVITFVILRYTDPGMGVSGEAVAACLVTMVFVVVAVLGILLPEINNWFFLGWVAMILVLFVVSLFNFGSPVVLYAVQEEFLPLAQRPEYHTWFWWIMLLGFVLYTLPLSFFCFWDEVRDAWRVAQRTIAQRHVVLRRLPVVPAPAAAPAPVPAPASAHSGGTLIDNVIRWTERILPSELIAEFLVEIGPRILARYI